MQVPKVVDLHSLQRFPDVLKRADLHKIQASLPHMPDLLKFRGELKTSLPSMDLLPSLSGWHKLFTDCLPELFSHANHTDDCVLVQFSFTLLYLFFSFSFSIFLGNSNLERYCPSFFLCHSYVYFSYLAPMRTSMNSDYPLCLYIV